MPETGPENWDEGVERILVVAAHPDDIDFGFAGSVAAWTEAGIDVTYCLVTDGEAGGSDMAISRPEMARIRREEQTKAAAEVGVSELVFLGFPDGRVVADFDLRRALTRAIRQIRPQRVVAQSAVRNLQRIYASHPDHLAAGEATLCAVYPDARNPFAFPELLERDGLEPWKVNEVWVGGFGATPDRWVDTTDVIDRKIAALLCHRSQLAAPDHMGPMLREWAAGQARACGLPEGRLAEVFTYVDTR